MTPAQNRCSMGRAKVVVGSNSRINTSARCTWLREFLSSFPQGWKNGVFSTLYSRAERVEVSDYQQFYSYEPTSILVGLDTKIPSSTSPGSTAPSISLVPRKTCKDST